MAPHSPKCPMDKCSFIALRMSENPSLVIPVVNAKGLNVWHSRAHGSLLQYRGQRLFKFTLVRVHDRLAGKYFDYHSGFVPEWMLKSIQITVLSNLQSISISPEKVHSSSHHAE